MTPEEMNQVVDSLKLELDKKGYLNTEGVDLLIAQKAAEIEKNIPDLTDIKAAVEAMGTEITKLLEQKREPQVMKSAKEVIKEKHADLLEVAKDFAKGNKRSIIFEVPTTKTLLQRTAVGSGTIAMYLPDVGQAAYQGLQMASLMNQRTLPAGMGGLIRYLDQTTVTRAADFKAEGAAFAESALAWTEYTRKIEKITDSIPVTWEALQDLAFVENEIMRMMDVNIAIKEDNALWNGDGNTPNLSGIYTYAPAVAINTSAFSASVLAPNVADLALAMKTLIATSKESKFMPNTVILSWSDWTKLLLNKSEYGYVQNPLMTPDGMMLAGMRVVPSSSVTANTMLVGDFRYADLYTDGMIRMEFGYVGDQFKEDEMTLKAAKRATLLVRNVDVSGFLKCTSISAQLAYLTASS